MSSHVDDTNVCEGEVSLGDKQEQEGTDELWANCRAWGMPVLRPCWKGALLRCWPNFFGSQGQQLRDYHTELLATPKWTGENGKPPWPK